MPKKRKIPIVEKPKVKTTNETTNKIDAIVGKAQHGEVYHKKLLKELTEFYNKVSFFLFLTINQTTNIYLMIPNLNFLIVCVFH